MEIRFGIGGIIAAGLMFAYIGAGTASAQYPPPEGSCVIATSAATTDPNTNVGVTVTVLDVNGKPVPGVATQLAISRQPGGDASLSPGTATTDGNGSLQGNLSTGNAAGLIALSARTGVVSCAASVVVGEGAVLSTIALPDTGTGPTGGGNSTALLASLVAGSLGVAGVAIAWRRRARSTR